MILHKILHIISQSVQFVWAERGVKSIASDDNFIIYQLCWNWKMNTRAQYHVISLQHLITCKWVGCKKISFIKSHIRAKPMHEEWKKLLCFFFAYSNKNKPINESHSIIDYVHGWECQISINLNIETLLNFQHFYLIFVSGKCWKFSVEMCLRVCVCVCVGMKCLIFFNLIKCFSIYTADTAEHD